MVRTPRADSCRPITQLVSRPRLAGFLLLLCVAWAPFISRAASIEEIRFGVLYHDLGVWGGSSNEGGLDVNAELVFSPSLELFRGIVRPNLGFSLNTAGDTSKIYGGGRVELPLA